MLNSRFVIFCLSLLTMRPTFIMYIYNSRISLNCLNLKVYRGILQLVMNDSEYIYMSDMTAPRWCRCGVSPVHAKDRGLRPGWTDRGFIRKELWGRNRISVSVKELVISISRCLLCSAKYVVRVEVAWDNVSASIILFLGYDLLET